MAAQIAAATVCIVPLRIGSGTRLKILESAAMAKAVVSTGVGAEGLEFRHQQEIMIADSAHEFAGQVIAILKDAGLRARLGRAARDRVEHCYSFEVLRRSLSAALAECAGKPSAHAATALIGGEMPLSPAKPSQAGAERSCQALSRQEAARN
jgi:glycosyltransferase involved in cell wall biosynthesis